MRLLQPPGFIAALLLPALLCLLTTMAPPAAADGKPWESDPIDPKPLEAALAKTVEDMKALPGGDQATTHSSAMHAILERRQGLLQDLLATVSAHRSIVTQADSQQNADADTKPANNKPPPTQAPAKPPKPDEVTPEGLEKLKHTVEQAHTRVTDLSGEVRRSRERADQLPDLLDQARDRAAKARDTLDELANETAASGNAQDLLALQLENAAISARTAALQIETLEKEQDLLRKQGPRLNARLDHEKEKLAPLEQAFAAYTEVLQQRQKLKTATLAQEAERKKQQAKAANSPAAKFLAEAEAGIAAIEHDNAAIAGYRTELSNEILELDNGLKADQADLRELQGMIATVGLTGPAAELLREIYGDIERRRRELRESVSPEASNWVDGISTQIISVQQQMARLNKTWRVKIAALPADETGSDDFKQQAEALLDQKRKALFKKYELLRLAGREGHQLQSLPIQRIAVLDELEDFVTRNVLWMQDARPLDSEVFANAHAELFSDARPNSLVNWLSQLRLKQLLADSSQVLGYSHRHLLGFLLVLVLPGLLWWFNRGNYAPGASLLRNLFDTRCSPPT